MLGNGRLEAMCFDGVKRLCHIRGKLRKKVDVWNLKLYYCAYLLGNPIHNAKYTVVFSHKCI